MFFKIGIHSKYSQQNTCVGVSVQQSYKPHVLQIY